MRLRFWMVLGLAALSGSMLPAPAPAMERDSAEIRCGVLTLRAAAREVREKAQCHERALRLGRGVDPNCLSRAEDKSARLLDRADPEAECFDRVTRGNLRISVDRFLIELVARVERERRRQRPSPQRNPRLLRPRRRRRR